MCSFFATDCRFWSVSLMLMYILCVWQYTHWLWIYKLDWLATLSKSNLHKYSFMKWDLVVSCDLAELCCFGSVHIILWLLSDELICGMVVAWNFCKSITPLNLISKFISVYLSAWGNMATASIWNCLQVILLLFALDAVLNIALLVDTWLVINFFADILDCA